MEITIKLKGFLKVFVFFTTITLALFSIAYFSYKAYKNIVYWKNWHAIHVKQKNRLVFSDKFEIADSTQKGYLLLSPYTIYDKSYFSEIIIMDFAGHILMQKNINGEVNDFRQWIINGHIRYTYCSSNPNDDSVDNSCITLMDSALNVLKKIYAPVSDAAHGKVKGIDNHDFILLSDDHYIILSDYEKTVNNVPVSLSLSTNCKVKIPVIQEINNGKVVWQWDISNYPEFYSNSIEGNKFFETDTAQDYIHLNSMTIDPWDSNLIVSLRNENQVVKINRHTGDIIWRLGGTNSDFPLTAQQVFLRQHHATLTDDNQTLLIFDNGEKNIRPSSRILEFRLDEKNKKIISFKASNIPEKCSWYRGSVQKIGNDYFICGGYNPWLLMVNSITGAKKMKMIHNQSLYRAYVVNDITGIKLSKK